MFLNTRVTTQKASAKFFLKGRRGERRFLNTEQCLYKSIEHTSSSKRYFLSTLIDCVGSRGAQLCLLKMPSQKEQEEAPRLLGHLQTSQRGERHCLGCTWAPTFFLVISTFPCVCVYFCTDTYHPGAPPSQTPTSPPHPRFNHQPLQTRVRWAAPSLAPGRSPHHGWSRRDPGHPTVCHQGHGLLPFCTQRAADRPTELCVSRWTPIPHSTQQNMHVLDMTAWVLFGDPDSLPSP